MTPFSDTVIVCKNHSSRGGILLSSGEADLRKMKETPKVDVMKKNRGFEVAKGFEGIEYDFSNWATALHLPIQSTELSAGYDFEASEEVTIYPIWGQVFSSLGSLLKFPQNFVGTDERGILNKSLKPTLVKTGIKAFMQDNEALYLYNRSSNPMKKFLLMSNGAGIVDADYYGNKDNDGHIMFQYINFGLFPVTFKKGEKVGQGIFQTVLKADKDKHRIDYKKRVGGHGSTDEEMGKSE